MTKFILPNDQRIGYLDCDSAFCALTDKEKFYAHYLAKASWYGGLIIPVQTSPESPLIYTLLLKLFQAESICQLKEKAISHCEFTEKEFKALLVYTSGIFSNFGNYKGFGDTKFVPDLPKDKFFKLITTSKAATLQSEKIETLLSNSIEKIYSLQAFEKQLGFPGVGTTTYLSKNITKDDLQIVKNFMKKQNFEGCNSRLFKTQDETGKACYEIRLSSILPTGHSEDSNLISTHVDGDHKFVFTRGDYSKLLQLVNENLQKAKNYAANETQAQMIDKFIHSFKTGSLDAHKDGCRFWIRDKSPAVESHIGFIETYKDPDGLRAEFEGIVAVVNRPMSEKVQLLVDDSDIFLTFLPWPSTYESELMVKPDFTAIDTLAYVSSLIFSGMCIPNYDDVKHTEGFKNFTLGNIMIAKYKNQVLNHLSAEDMDLLQRSLIQALEVDVGLHELLGHGSGKLFRKDKNGCNFDENVIDIETKDKITSWYENGETFDSLFGSISSAFEECRAECVALYLSTYPEILRIFGFQDPKIADDIMYVVWLVGLYGAITGLEMYEPSTNSWLEAHRQADFAMLQVCLEESDDFVYINEVVGEDGNPDILFTIDRTKILTVGYFAIGSFLQKLQLYRSTANVDKGSKMFLKYTTVTNEGKYPFLKYREIVLARKLPGKLLVQANTFIENGKVILKPYEASTEGMINSVLERYKDVQLDNILEELWFKDNCYFA